MREVDRNLHGLVFILIYIKNDKLKYKLISLKELIKQ
jgi:hypothetical protein